MKQPNSKKRTKEQKQTRLIRTIAVLIIIAVLVTTTLSLVFYKPTTTTPVSSVITVCGRTGEFSAITGGTPVLYKGQVVAWLSYFSGYVGISINNGAPEPIHPYPMADGDEASFRFIIESNGRVYGEVTISGFACGDGFYYELPNFQFVPNQNI